MSARSQLQSKPVADLRQIADGLGLEHAGLQKAKLIDLLLDQGDAIGDISNGAEEVEQGDEDNLIISVEAEEFHNLKNVLEENEIKINQYELIMKASNSVELDDEASEKVINLLESLEDLDDVQNVHSNAEFSEGSFA